MNALSGWVQAVYTVLREAEHRSTAPIPYWNLPFAAMLVPQQRKVQEALVTINSTLDSLICKCKQLVPPPPSLSSLSLPFPPLPCPAMQGRKESCKCEQLGRLSTGGFVSMGHSSE